MERERERERDWVDQGPAQVSRASVTPAPELALNNAVENSAFTALIQLRCKGREAKNAR